jgi:ATP-dependent Clp protease ATP-binding subunit ClpB
MDFKQFTIKSQEAIQNAAELAAASGSPAVETAHLLKGIFSEDADVSQFLLQRLSVNSQLLGQKLEEELQKLPKVSGGNQSGAPGLSH